MKIFMSAGENPEHAKKMVGVNCKNILLSYYYIRKRRIENPWVFDNCAPDAKFIVDSGAHTIQKGVGDLSNEELDTFYQEYTKDYLNWCERHKDKLEAVAELDIEKYSGVEYVYMLQKKYFEPFEKRTGVPVIYVWHPQRGFREWDAMCAKRHFVGLNDEVGNKIRNMVGNANKRKVKVHGFAFTRPETLLKCSFYTVDSTRWLTGELYGCLFIWWRGSMIELRKDNKAARKRYKNYFRDLGLDFQKIMDDDAVELGKANVAAWMKCEDYINRRTQRVQWWNNPNDPNALQTLKDMEAEEMAKKKAGLTPRPPEHKRAKPFGMGEKATEDAPEMTVSSGAVKSPSKAPKNAPKTPQNAPETPDTTQEPVEGGKPPISHPRTVQTPQNTPSEPPRAILAEGESDNTCSPTHEIAPAKGDGRSSNGAILDDSDHARLADARKKVYVEAALTCDNCYATETCPKAQKGAVCSLISTFSKLGSRDAMECVKKIREIIETLEQRAWRNLYFEQLDGGYAGKDVTGLMHDLIEYHKMLAELYKETLPRQEKITIEGSAVLDKIFGPKQVINVPAEPPVTDAEVVPSAVDEPKTTQGAPKSGSPLANSLREMLRKRDNPS